MDGTTSGQENENPNTPTRKRALQNVSTKAQRVRVLNWMNATTLSCGNTIHLVSTAVKQFPQVFRATSINANLVKCARWYKQKGEILKAYETDNLSLNHTYVEARKRVELKAALGRGRKMKEWI